MERHLVYALCLLFLTAAGCGESPQETSDKNVAANDQAVKMLSTDQLKHGPIRHERLTEDQMNRIQSLQKIMAEVDPSPIKKWVDNFKRELDLESELQIWEAIAGAYVSYCSTHELTLAHKKEVYAILLFRSMLSEEETLQQVELKLLSTEDARQVMRGYRLDAAPIIVE
jgi:hypothetical protein